MSGITVRAATVQDLDAIQALLNASWRNTYAEAIPAERMEGILARRHARKLLADQLGEADSVFVVATSNGAIVGHAYARHTGKSLYLDRLHVEPGLKGAGIGKKLMKTVFDAVNTGETVMLELVSGNDRALKFYEGLGFRVTERTPSCGGEMEVEALVMEKAVI